MASGYIVACGGYPNQDTEIDEQLALDTDCNFKRMGFMRNFHIKKWPYIVEKPCTSDSFLIVGEK